MTNRSERVSLTHWWSGSTTLRWAALSTQLRKGSAPSHSLVISHCEALPRDWHSWSLMWPGTLATWWRICS